MVRGPNKGTRCHIYINESKWQVAHLKSWDSMICCNFRFSHGVRAYLVTRNRGTKTEESLHMTLGLHLKSHIKPSARSQQYTNMYCMSALHISFAVLAYILFCYQSMFLN